MKEQEKHVYWANICLLGRMEKEYLNQKAESWQQDNQQDIQFSFLGNTEEVVIYDRLAADIEDGHIKADAIVSTRFDLFCWDKYLKNHQDQFRSLSQDLPLADTLKRAGYQHPTGVFHPVLALPHLIMCNTHLVEPEETPDSFSDLLDDKWASQIVIGDPALPSGKFFLFTMWYLFGNQGLEKIVQNTICKTAPPAARFSVMKDEYKLAILPEIFTGPTPEDNLKRIVPQEGVFGLPSFLAVKQSAEDLLPFLKHALFSDDIQQQYVNQGQVIPNSDTVSPPAAFADQSTLVKFPDWSWIESQDIDYFDYQCGQVKKV